MFLLGPLSAVLLASVHIQAAPAPYSPPSTLDNNTNTASSIPAPYGAYSFINVQIALRKPADTDSAPGGDLCLHPGGPSPDPGTPSIGLYGGLKVGLTACSQAGYRWSVRQDGKGIVLGNGEDPIWSLNAEEVEVGSTVTIREADAASANQEFRLVQGHGQIRLGYTEGPLLCLEGDEDDGKVKVAVCGTDDVREQSWVILMLPQPIPASSGVASTHLPSLTSSWVQPSDPTYSMPIVRRTPV